MYRSSIFGHENIVRLLLEQPNVDVNHKDRKECTEIMSAFCNGHRNLVGLLLTRTDISGN
jgi:hypothetical protein